MSGDIMFFGIVIIFILVVCSVMTLSRSQYYRANWVYYARVALRVKSSIHKHYVRRKLHARNMCILFVLLTAALFTLLLLACCTMVILNL